MKIYLVQVGEANKEKDFVTIQVNKGIGGFPSVYRAEDVVTVTLDEFQALAKNLTKKEEPKTKPLPEKAA